MNEQCIGILFILKQLEELQHDLEYSDMNKEEKIGYLSAIRDILIIINKYQNTRV